MADWIAATLALSGVWLIVTVAAVLLNIAAHWAVPDAVMKIGPFIIAGFITARLVDVSRWQARLVAVAVLAVVSASAWTVFVLATREVTPGQALLLFGVSLP